MDNKPPTIAIPVPSDKKLVKLSKLIPAPASCCFKLLETIVDITVLVNESPPKTNTIIIVMNNDVSSEEHTYELPTRRSYDLGNNILTRKGMYNKPPSIAIPVTSDKKLVKLSKLIPAPASCCFKLLETIVDITVLVNESPPKTNTIIIVMNHDV